MLFLGVTVTAELLTLHAQEYQAANNQAVTDQTAVKQTVTGQAVGWWPLYRPGHWVPHCTLATGLDREQRAAAFRALHGYQPVKAVVTAVGLTDNATGAVTLLAGS